MPLRKKITQIIDVHPYAELWYINCLMDSTTMATLENRQKNIPIAAAITSGIVENEVRASSEYITSPINDHLVLPAHRSTFSNSSHFVLKPTHSYIPFMNRLYSGISKMASITLRLIRRKSLAPSTNFNGDKELRIL